MGMGEVNNNISISDDEILYRAFSAPKCIDNKLGKPNDLIFVLKKKEKDISLGRAVYTTLNSFCNQARKFRWLFKTESFYGIATLNAREIRSLNKNIILVGPSSLKNISHAGIIFLLPDGSPYVGCWDTDQAEDPTILGYRLQLCNIIREVYDSCSRLIWEKG